MSGLQEGWKVGRKEGDINATIEGKRNETKMTLNS
jgi:hypothetical protein